MRTAVPAVSILAFLLCTAVVVWYAIQVHRSGRLRHERLGDRPGSALFPGWMVEAFYGMLTTVGRVLVKLKVEPDTLTLLSLLCSLVSAPLLAGGHLAEGAMLIAAGGALDALDGLVARARGCASKAGAFLDSVVDRLSDAAPFAGLAVFYRGSAWLLLVPFAALVASSLVSYVRARAEAHGLTLPNGFMRRHERIAYLLACLLLAPLWPESAWLPGVPYPAALLGVAFIGASGFVAALVLASKARAALLQMDRLERAAPRPSAERKKTTRAAENSTSIPPAC